MIPKTRDHVSIPPAGSSPGAGAARMHTIAERLGLSVATVSRALRGVAGINARTRARVFEAAAQLGYQLPRSFRAEDLQNGKLHHVAVLVQTPPTQAASPHYLVGMSEAAMSLNASLVVHHVEPGQCDRLLEPKFQPRAMQSGLVSGVIFVFRWPPEVVRAISRRFATVSITHRYPGVDLDLIGVDNHEGADLLVSHLHGLGHRRIGFLGRCPDLHWATQRFAGYVAALNRLGLAYEPGWVVDMSLAALTDPRHAFAVSEEPLAQVERCARGEGVRAWVCSSETVGQGLHRWVQARPGGGLRVPEELSLTGFHRSPAGAGAEEQPPLTSVTASYQAMGAAALKRLLFRIQNPVESTRRVLFPFELYPGVTSAAPPSPFQGEGEPSAVAAGAAAPTTAGSGKTNGSDGGGR